MEFKHFKRIKDLVDGELAFSNGWMDYRQKLMCFVTRHDGLDPIEDHQYATNYFGQLIRGYDIKDVVIALDDNDEIIGFIWGDNGDIGLVKVPLALRRKQIATKMLKLYLEKTEPKAGKYEYYSHWFHEDVGLAKLFLAQGFTITSIHDVQSPTLTRIIATKAAPDDFHEKRLDAADRGYVDFREDYAVVDGHYTLDQLESLLVLARKELKGG
jgi:hypothetical protein